jgi:hypothetical protein
MEVASKYLYLESGGPEDEEEIEEVEIKPVTVGPTSASYSAPPKKKKSINDDGETCLLDILE